MEILDIDSKIIEVAIETDRAARLSPLTKITRLGKDIGERAVNVVCRDVAHQNLNLSCEECE